MHCGRFIATSVILGVALTGCYQPSVRDCQLQCGVDGVCPAGLVCVHGFCRLDDIDPVAECIASAASDADIRSVVDAHTVPDGPAVDAPPAPADAASPDACICHSQDANRCEDGHGDQDCGSGGHGHDFGAPARSSRAMQR